jgi:hypothetical protein
MTKLRYYISFFWSIDIIAQLQAPDLREGRTLTLLPLQKVLEWGGAIPAIAVIHHSWSETAIGAYNSRQLRLPIDWLAPDMRLLKQSEERTWVSTVWSSVWILSVLASIDMVTVKTWHCTTKGTVSELHLKWGWILCQEGWLCWWVVVKILWSKRIEHDANSTSSILENLKTWIKEPGRGFMGTFHGQSIGGKFQLGF